jgi:hypothetical protein
MQVIKKFHKKIKKRFLDLDWQMKVSKITPIKKQDLAKEPVE